MNGAEPTMPKTLKFAIENGDILSYPADVVAFKHAAGFYGADLSAVRMLAESSTNVALMALEPGQHHIVDSIKILGASKALFIGTPGLNEIGYDEIEVFTKQVLEILATSLPRARHLAMTIHGPGFGLDELGAAFAQFAGLYSSFISSSAPSGLDRISIVDINADRVERLRLAFDNYFEGLDYASKSEGEWVYLLDFERRKQPSFKPSKFSPQGHEVSSGPKPHAFVAMPFSEDMDDVFYYGIQKPIHSIGYLCERADQAAFTGGIMEQVIKRINTAKVVVAEVTDANPNVYLEVGYAWGRERPVVLLAKDINRLSFDLRGYHCITYKKIKDLEEKLGDLLRQLREEQAI
jgi:hypothetical protein